MERTLEVYHRLLDHYGPQGWWPAHRPFEVIVGALLMQQTAWANVARAIANLKAAGLLDPQALAAAPVATIRRHVRVAGLYRVKPRRLKAFSRHLLARSGGNLERYFDRPLSEVRADLLDQEGIGPETADSILLYAGPHATFVVDAYTTRIARRIGLVSSERYEDVKAHFEARIGPDLATYREFHALFVAHGKALCRPRPRCGECPLCHLCDYGRKEYPGP